MEELKILIQEPEARSFLENQRKDYFKELERHDILKQLYEPESITNISLSSIFQKGKSLGNAEPSFCMANESVIVHPSQS